MSISSAGNVNYHQGPYQKGWGDVSSHFLVDFAYKAAATTAEDVL